MVWMEKYERYISKNGEVFRVDKKGHLVECKLSLVGVKGKIQYYQFRYGHRPNLKQQKVHRAVAEAFIPNPENQPTVDHIDRNPLNNNVENLRWASWEVQADNRSSTIFRLPISVRAKDNPTVYKREFGRLKRMLKMIHSHCVIEDNVPTWRHQVGMSYTCQRKSKYY